MYFRYGQAETDYLKARDPVLGELIEKIGPVRREVDPDLFSSVVHHVVGQQVSTKAQATIWARLQELLDTVDAAHVLARTPAELQSVGMTFRKVDYIREFARRVSDGEFDLAAVAAMPDEEAIAALCALPGIGRWTAEMILLFCLERPDVLAFDDLAIQRGLRMVYHHRRITRKLFEKYRRRYSPYGSVASLYLWAVAGGVVPGMRDYAPKTKLSSGKV